MNASSSKQNSGYEDEEIFDDSRFLANFDNTSFKQTHGPGNNVNDSFNTSALNVSALCCDEEISGYDKITGQTWIYPTNYSVRDYQFNIIKNALLKNTLVSLPTGLGKTFIAAVVMYNFYRWYPLGKIVFTAPTRPLVAQQIDACYNIVAIPPNDTIEMTGHMQVNTRKTHWQTKRVFFATPQVIYNDLKSGICPADAIRCLVVDEAHRAKGNYAYCQIVGTLDDLGLKTYRLLALSATPGSKVDDVVSVVRSLHISHLELRTENCIDVAPYSHSRKIDTVIVQLGPELTQLRQHYVEILDHYARRLKQFNILPQNLGNLSKGRIVMLYKEYQNTDRGSRHPQHNYIMKDFTLLIALYHGLELLVKHGSRVFLNFFDEHPEKSWIQSDDRLTALLERLRDDLGINPLGLDRSILPDGTIPDIPNNLCFGHPKFDKLKAIMVEHFTNAINKKQDTRAIVFCEYRESVNLVHCLLLQCRPLITPQMFVGQGASGKDGKTIVSQKQQLRVMRAFREGVCNALVATCVAEEGLDVGSVDLILCFDISTRSPIRLVQRCGRTGRERGGQVYILVTEGREHQTLLDCMRQRDGLNRKIKQSKEVENNLYKNNPRMVPHGFTPQCQKMYITVAKKEDKETDKKEKGKAKKQTSGQKDLRSMLAGRPSTSIASSIKKVNFRRSDSPIDEEFQGSEAKKPEPMDVDEPIIINSQDTQPQKTAISSHAKSKQTKKKQKTTAKSPAKNCGDIRALFSTATKSTKSYTKLINELGVNDSGLPTKLINLLVDLNLDTNNNTQKTCYICQNICNCQKIKQSETYKPVQLKFINDPCLPSLDLIDDMNKEVILNYNKSMEESQDIIDKISKEVSSISKSSEQQDKANCSANFDLEFDFDALDAIDSPENKPVDKNINTLSDANFDLGDIDALVATDSPGNQPVDENTNTVTDTNFDLGDIDDIFADSSPEENILAETEIVNLVTEPQDGILAETQLLNMVCQSQNDILAETQLLNLETEPQNDMLAETQRLNLETRPQYDVLPETQLLNLETEPQNDILAETQLLNLETEPQNAILAETQLLNIETEKQNAILAETQLLNEEIEQQTKNTSEIKDKPKETEEALGFFGLDSIDDIFADSDDSVIQVSPEPPKLETKSTPEKNRTKFEKDVDTIKDVPNSALSISPSILSGKVAKSVTTSPILCSQAKFQPSNKSRPSSSTPNTRIRKKLIPDPTGNNEDNVILIDDDEQKSNVKNDTTNKSMFTITQLVDIINKSGDKSANDVNLTNQRVEVISDDDRSTSPILLTQADRKRSINTLSQSERKPVKNKSNKNETQSKSFIILDSDSDSNEEIDKKICDYYQQISKLDISNKTNNKSSLAGDKSGFDDDDNDFQTPGTSSKADTSKRISFFDAVCKETSEKDTQNKTIDSSLNNKRKFEDNSDSITASPYFNKKQKLEDAVGKPLTLQQKVLAALSNKDKKEINNSHINYHCTMSYPDLSSQKENTMPKELKHKLEDKEKENKISALDVLQKYKKENKILSLRKKFNTIFKSPKKSPVKISPKTSPLKTSICENSDEDFLSCEGYFSSKKTSRNNQKKEISKKKIVFEESDDDFVNDNGGPSSLRVTEKDKRIRSTTNHKVRKKKRHNNSLLDMEAALSNSDSGDELTDDSAGSIAEFICDDDVTHHEDIHAVYMKSVRSPVKKNGFKIPELPKKYNQADVFSQFVLEDSYEMDSFCVDSHIGLTQVQEISELELAEMALREKKRKKKHRSRSPSPEDKESPLIKRKFKKVNRLNSDSEDSS